MSDNLFFPRVETIAVPDNVRPESVGKYVSYMAYKILEETGQASYNHKSLHIEIINERLYALKFHGKAPLPPKADIYREVPNPQEPRVMEEDRLALGNTPRLGQVVEVANTKKRNTRV